MLIRKNLILAALILSAVFFSTSAFAQQSVLVDGNPPLTQTDLDSIAEYYERGLDIQFTGEQRVELQDIVVRQWKKGQRINPKYLSDWLVTIRKINGIGGEKREKIKGEIHDVVLSDLRDSRGSELSKFVLDVYENREQQSESSAPSEPGPARMIDPAVAKPGAFNGTLKLSDLSGTWGKATTATYGYRNTITNDYRSGYGAANQHDVYPSGTFDYTNYAQISGYGCTTELYTSMKGRVTVSGSQVTFTYTSGTVRVEDSCKKSSLTRPAHIDATVYRAERVEGKLRLCEIGKENPTCLDKAER